jgi:hypothetical protein
MPHPRHHWLAARMASHSGRRVMDPERFKPDPLNPVRFLQPFCEKTARIVDLQGYLGFAINESMSLPAARLWHHKEPRLVPWNDVSLRTRTDSFTRLCSIGGGLWSPSLMNGLPPSIPETSYSQRLLSICCNTRTGRYLV